MQYFDNPLVIAIALMAALFVIIIMSFSILAKAGKKTFKTYHKGRTASEKFIYLLSTIMIFFVVVGIVVSIAFLDFIPIPYTDSVFNLEFIVDKVYYVGIAVVVLVLIFSYVIITAHQRSTNFGEVVKKELQGRRNA